jgi:hypothetical protein
MGEGELEGGGDVPTEVAGCHLHAECSVSMLVVDGPRRKCGDFRVW